MNEKRDWLSSTQGTALLRCPFFMAHGEQEIKCEGVIDGTSIKTTFCSRDEKRWHQEIYCEKEYKRCEMYCSIMHWKWPEEK